MNVSPVPRPWGALRLVSPVLCLGLLVGCQTYRPIPLDLSRHSADLGDRLATEESIRAFSQRLEADHPDRSQGLDLTDGIDAAEAEVIALFYNPDLRLARLRAGIALANAENAGLWQDPVFGFDGAELLSPSGPFEFGLTLSLTIPVSGVLEVEQDRANALYDAQWWRVLAAEWSMRTQVRDAWANWAAANERLALVNEIVQAVERIGVISSRLEDAGELTRLEAR
ncbi:MAG: TolC family protein, partial [Pseudomonadota bacterium]